MSSRSFLVIVRAGQQSLHVPWLESRRRNYDVFVSTYGAQAPTFPVCGDFEEHAPGLKWPVISELFKSRPDLFMRYHGFWFPDDDVAATPSVIEAMFVLFQERRLWLAQPALGMGSYIAHQITAQQSDTLLRFTDFAEVMCPLFARETLLKLAPTFDWSVTGYGLDYVWPYLLGYPPNRIAILDSTPVIHTRKYASGDAYKRFNELGLDPEREQAEVMARYGLPKRLRARVFGSISHAPEGQVTTSMGRVLDVRRERNN